MAFSTYSAEIARDQVGYMKPQFQDNCTLKGQDAVRKRTHSVKSCGENDKEGHKDE